MSTLSRNLKIPTYDFGFQICEIFNSLVHLISDRKLATCV